jgi:uncharacterized protein (DUF1778 family)
MSVMTKKRARKAPPKLARLDLRVQPQQMREWQRAADISHEGNLSMWLRAAADVCAAATIGKENAS